jgi:hypothetical protein
MRSQQQTNTALDVNLYTTNDHVYLQYKIEKKVAETHRKRAKLEKCVLLDFFFFFSLEVSSFQRFNVASTPPLLLLLLLLRTQRPPLPPLTALSHLWFT